MLKICRKCHQNFEVPRCKPCHAAYMREWYAKNPEKHRTIKLRTYTKNREKVLANTKAYARAHPEIRAKGQVNYRAKYPLKNRAHQLVNSLFRSRRIVKQPCRICGNNTKVEAHHDDYSRPLDVEWLCETHHKAWHRVFIAENP